MGCLAGAMGLGVRRNAWSHRSFMLPLAWAISLCYASRRVETLGVIREPGKKLLAKQELWHVLGELKSKSYLGQVG